jgi:hypothetical protein
LLLGHADILNVSVIKSQEKCDSFSLSRAREVAMAERIIKRSVSASRPSPFNWLKWLDDEVRKFPGRANWRQHPPFQFARCQLFMMTRYPQLFRFFPDEVLYRELTCAEKRILEHPEARHALDGLKDRQRKELAALFLDSDTSLMSYKAHGRSTKRVHKLAAEAPSRTRMLTRKLGKARRALEDLREYAESLDELLGWKHARATKTCLEALQELKKDTDPEFYRSIEAEYPALEDPVALSTVQLYWFLRHGCRRSGDEAEVRVARIRNAFWPEHGVAEVPFRPEYQTGESKGCDAVHVTILRFKQGTSRRKSS